MSDDFLTEARRQWQNQDQDLERMVRRLRWQQLRMKVMIVTEAASAVLGVALGVWFLFWKIDPAHVVFFRLTAVMMLTAVPVLAVVSVMVRRRRLHWESETPESVLHATLGRLIIDEKLLKVSFLGAAYVLAGFVVVEWVCAALGWVPVDGKLMKATVVFLVMSGGVWLWARWRLGRIAQERRHCNEMLDKYS